MELLPAIAAATISIAAAVASFVLARRLGLTAIQRAVDEEEAKLVATLRERLILAEQKLEQAQLELAKAEAKIAHLQIENDDLRRRVSSLERVVIQQAVPGA